MSQELFDFVVVWFCTAYLYGPEAKKQNPNMRACQVFGILAWLLVLSEVIFPVACPCFGT